MGRRIERVTALAGDMVYAGGTVMVAVGLVPMLWSGDGFSGAVDRTGTWWPATVATVLGAHAYRAWKGRRVERGAEEAEEVTPASEPDAG